MPRAVSFCTGRSGPLRRWIEASLLRPTMSRSAAARAWPRSETWPGWIRSKQPLVKAMRSPRGAPALDTLQRAFQRHDLRFARQHGAGLQRAQKVGGMDHGGAELAGGDARRRIGEPRGRAADRRRSPRRSPRRRWRYRRRRRRRRPRAPRRRDAAVARPGSTRVMPRSLRVTSSAATPAAAIAFWAAAATLSSSSPDMPVAAASSPRLGVSRSAPA